MRKSAFRSYDIRGRMESEINVKDVYTFSRALSFYFVERNPEINSVVVGMDVRQHSNEIKTELVKGLIQSGLNVVDIGICPTPVVYFAIRKLISVGAGIIITASHNSKEYNGFKVEFGTESVCGQEIDYLYKLFCDKKSITRPKLGICKKYDMSIDYVKWMVNHFHTLRKAKILAVVDFSNGTAGCFFLKIIKDLEIEGIESLFEDQDGSFPNHNPDPTEEKNMKQLINIVRNGKFKLGLGFDGDGDRVSAVTDSGELVLGDKLLGIFSDDILKKHPKASIVFDSKCSSILPDVIKKNGGSCSMVASGRSVVRNQMFLKKAILAGEYSCHFFFGDRHFGYDDGIYAAFRLLEILVKNDVNLTSFLSKLPKMFSSKEIRLSCSESDKNDIVEKVKKKFSTRDNVDLVFVDGVRVTTSYGWGVIRGCNTQPAISLRFESTSELGLLNIKQDFFKIMSSSFEKDFLEREFEL